MNKDENKDKRKKAGEKIRILFVYNGICDVMLNKKGHGGAEVQLYLLARELSKDKRFHIMVTNFKDHSPRLDKGKNIEIIDVPKYNWKNSGDDWMAIKIKKMRNRIINLGKIIRADPDIFITRTANVFVFRNMMMAKLLNKRSVFMTAHDWDCDGTYEKKKSNEDMLYREGVMFSDAVICQNTYQEKELKKNYEKDAILMNSMYPVPQIKDRRRGSVLWIGRCERWKRPEMFLELAKKNPGHRFLMISACANKQQGYYDEIRRRAHKIKNLEFREYIPFDRIDSTFRKAKLFVNTSTYEGFPNTFVQAAKNKTPILSMNVNPNKMFQKHKIGFCADDDFVKMNKIFKRIIDDNDVLKDLGDNGFIYAKKEHDIKEIAEKYKVIFSALKEHRKPCV